MKVLTKVAMVFGGIAMAAGMTAGPASASVASNPYDPIALCNAKYGTGFAYDSSDVTLRTPRNHEIVGIGYFMYNARNGYNCVVTLSASPGTAFPMNAKIRKSGGTWVPDPGDYKWYAGPVGVHAPGQCVQWYAMARSISYTSPWGHCG